MFGCRQRGSGITRSRCERNKGTSVMWVLPFKDQQHSQSNPPIPTPKASARTDYTATRASILLHVLARGRRLGFETDTNRKPTIHMTTKSASRTIHKAPNVVRKVTEHHHTPICAVGGAGSRRGGRVGEGMGGARGLKRGAVSAHTRPQARNGRVRGVQQRAGDGQSAP